MSIYWLLTLVSFQYEKKIRDCCKFVVYIRVEVEGLCTNLTLKHTKPLRCL